MIVVSSLNDCETRTINHRRVEETSSWDRAKQETRSKKLEFNLLHGGAVNRTRRPSFSSSRHGRC